MFPCLIEPAEKEGVTIDEDADLSEFETFVDEDDDDDTYLGKGKLYNRIIIHCFLVL